MKRILSLFLALILGPVVLAADSAKLQTELQGVVNQIQAKMKAGKNIESDYAEELKDFDRLLSEKKGDSETLAQALLIKAILYLQVFENTKEGAAIVRTIKNDYPETRAGKGAEKMLALIATQEAGAKVRETLVAGTVFPDFQARDLEGRPISVSSFKGKMVLINFWAAASKSSRIEIPSLVRIHTKFRQKGFEVIGVSLDTSKPLLTSFTAEHKIKWPQYFDGLGFENKLAVQYGVNRLPTSYLLDKAGKIVGVNLNWIELEDALAAGLGQ